MKVLRTIRIIQSKYKQRKQHSHGSATPYRWKQSSPLQPSLGDLNTGRRNKPAQTAQTSVMPHAGVLHAGVPAPAGHPMPPAPWDARPEDSPSSAIHVHPDHAEELTCMKAATPLGEPVSTTWPKLLHRHRLETPVTGVPSSKAIKIIQLIESPQGHPNSAESIRGWIMHQFPSSFVSRPHCLPLVPFSSVPSGFTFQPLDPVKYILNKALHPSNSAAKSHFSLFLTMRTFFSKPFTIRHY